MTSQESELINIDRTVTCKVKMGSRDLVQATGKGTLVVKTQHGKRYIQEVLLVPGLDENLLSVGQMMEHGYYILFGGNKAVIFDDESDETILFDSFTHIYLMFCPCFIYKMPCHSLFYVLKALLDERCKRE